MINGTNHTHQIGTQQENDMSKKIKLTEGNRKTENPIKEFIKPEPPPPPSPKPKDKL